MEATLLRNLLSCLNSGSLEDKLVELVSKGGGVKVEDFCDTLGQAFVVAESVQTAGMAKLYNSRCTNHISPYQNQLKNFQSITPCHFRAANKQTFSTISKGELAINVPNGDGTTQLHLMDVLYSAEVGYTLVLVGRLDEARFTVVFGGGKCMLKGEDDVEIGVVPRMMTRVYKVEHEEVIASTAEEQLTLDKFYCCMGHIWPNVTCKLIKDKMVTRVCLKYLPPKTFSAVPVFM